MIFCRDCRFSEFAYLAAMLPASILWACGGQSAEAGFEKVTGSRPVRFCLAVHQTERNDLASGRRRLVLATIRYSPTDSRTSLHVRSVDGGVKFRTPLMQRRGFEAESSENALRYFLPKSKGPIASNLCYNISLIGDVNASAKVRIELSGKLR